jgi:hypothetical protein
MQRHVHPFAAVLLILTLAAAAWSTNNVLVAQDAEKEPAKKEKSAKGRLPNFFGEVVSGEQREAIYAIQAKFRPEIEKLQAELAAVERKMNAEIETVLTPEQKTKVEALRAAAAAKKKAAKDSPEGSNE